MQEWAARKQELSSVNQAFRSSLLPERQGTLGKLDVFLMMDMLQKCGHVDQDYVQDLVDGFPLTGNISAGGLGIPVDGGQRVHGKPASVVLTI